MTLAAVVIDAIDTVRPLLTSRGHHLMVALPPESVTFLADPLRLQQVLTHLLTNAAQYTDSGGKICMAADVADGGLVLRVSDNGNGIAPDLLPHVFDPFRRAEPAGNRARRLGIGLALARSLVELHGGTIVVFSNGPGTGSEFVVRLPRCDPKLEADDIAGVFALYSVAASTGLWAHVGGPVWQIGLAAVVGGGLALAGFVRWVRTRSARRWRTALESYAVREIARERPSNP